MRFLRTCFLVAGILPAATMAPAHAAEPLARASAFSLELPENGTPGAGFFPMGFVYGVQAPTAAAGFTMWPNTTGIGDALDKIPSLAPADRSPDGGHGFHYFINASPAGELGKRMLWYQNKNDGRPAPVATQRYGALPPALSAAGMPKKRNAENLPNLFDPGMRRYLSDYGHDFVSLLSRPVIGRPSGDDVFLWAMDNEWEGQPDYSPQARAAFGPWLEKAYGGDIAGLDEAWRASFTTFAEAARTELPAPGDYAKNPGLFLDFWNFQTENFTTVLAGIASAMQEADPLKRGVVLKSTQQTIEMPVVNRARTFDHARFAELMRPVSGGYYGIDIYGHGDREAYETNYIYNCIRPLDRAPGYGVMYGETNNHDGPGHQFASTFWRVLANGAKSVMYFTGGFAGAKGDWDKFGFFSAETGAPKSKFFYAARWASMVHRTEGFWERSVPAAGLPRVALLMPRRDVLLSPPSEQQESRWAYPENNRLHVFTWLRERGYWVDVIPYTKLNRQYLAAYDGLFLIGAEHLTAAECAVIRAYAHDGGTVVADGEPGRYDEHHRLRARLDDLLGVRFPAGSDDQPVSSSREKITFDAGRFKLTAQGARDEQPTVARAFSRAASGRPLAFLNTVGQGRVLSFPFDLGTLAIRGEGGVVAGFIPEGPTADSGEETAYTGEFVFGEWLSGLLSQAGLAPAYAPAGKWTPDFGRLRLEAPMTDARGNVALVVGNRALSRQEILPPQRVLVPLPGGPWTHALWAAAENDGLVEIPIRPAGGPKTKNGDLHAIDLPEIPSVGVLYLFRDHDPLLGVAPVTVADGAAGFSIDGQTAQVRPGHPVRLHIQLFNTTGGALPAGILRGLAPEGWALSPDKMATPVIGLGEHWETTVTLEPPADDDDMQPDWLYPVVFRWRDGAAARDRAVIATHVEGLPDPAGTLCLLTDNATYPTSYPHRISTGATYGYDGISPEVIHDPAAEPAKGPAIPALTNGYAFGGRAGSRMDAPSDTTAFARYDTRRVAIDFDLKGLRTVRKVVIIPGPGAVRPFVFHVLTSDDNRHWTARADVTPPALAVQVETPLFRAPARYVRLEAVWPLPGGTLSEVEIWGR